MATVPRRTSLRSSTIDNSLGGHGYQQVGKPGARKALAEIGNKSSLIGPSKPPTKKHLGKPISLASKAPEKPKKSTAGLQESQAHQPAARKISRHDKTVVEESRATVGAQEKSHEVDVPQAAVAFSELLQIEDIDSADRDNPQLCAEYVAEIYQYMMQLERKYVVPVDFMSDQREVTSAMRSVLVDWLIQVQQRFKLLQETLYVTVSIIDRFLSLVNVPRTKLQLVGVTSMLIASKYEETYAPMVEDFVFVTDRAYSQVQIRAMEGEILKTLDFELGKPFCLQFLRRNSKAGGADALMHTVAKYLMELTLPEYDFSAFPPSQVAAASLYLTMKLLGRGTWNATVEHHSGCSEAKLLPCARKLGNLLSKTASEKKITAVREKYASSAFMGVSKMSELQADSVAALALS